VAHFIEPLLRHHDRAAVEVYCYAHVPRPDAFTEKLRGLADAWRDVTGLPENEIAEQLRADGIDILIDLAGHTAVELLPVFARRPVPVQGTYLGYANTSGLTTMDFRLTDALADPPGVTDALHTETLVRLPRGFLCYAPPPEAAEPFVCKGPLTFASFNYLAKATPEVVGLWARILKAVPGSRLILKSRPLSDPMAKERYLKLFEAHGIRADRLDLLGWIPAKDSHLVQYNRVHVALDPFPYNGTTTTCEALWMGVPVVTLAGRVHAARVGVSILSHVGFPELIARDHDEYVKIAAGLVQNTSRLAELRRTLRDRMRASPLLDGPGFARAVEGAYRERWRTWCAALGNCG
jgi:predicted O-linked N-acetylglucosamine transferase (SPINDLY family)